MYKKFIVIILFSGLLIPTQASATAKYVFPVANCEVGTSTARLGSVAFTISAGQTNIVASLSAFASFGTPN